MRGGSEGKETMTMMTDDSVITVIGRTVFVCVSAGKRV